MKYVKSAKIQIVNFKDLKIGDFILFDNQKRELVDINNLNGFIVLQSLKYKNREGHNATQNYLKIVECEEFEVDD